MTKLRDYYGTCPEDDLIAEIQRLRQLINEDRAKYAALVDFVLRREQAAREEALRFAAVTCERRAGGFPVGSPQALLCLSLGATIRKGPTDADRG